MAAQFILLALRNPEDAKDADDARAKLAAWRRANGWT
jgi:hypothetical protein